MTAGSAGPAGPDTIVLIHGLWMTARSWEYWAAYYRRAGYEVLTPSYPGLEIEVEALRADPAPIEKLTIGGTAAHYEAIIRGLDKPPILIGHSFGGAVVQLMLDRGLGAAGVAIDSVPVQGVKVVPFVQGKAAWPVLAHVSTRRKAVPLTFEQFEYAFSNACTEQESRAAYERYCVPAPGRIVWDSVLANFRRYPATRVDFARSDRAPLLFIAGGADRLMPPAVNSSNYRRYLGRSDAVVAYREFPGRSHFTLGQPGWQDVADWALSWAENPTALDTTGAPRPPPGWQIRFINPSRRQKGTAMFVERPLRAVGRRSITLAATMVLVAGLLPIMLTSADAAATGTAPRPKPTIVLVHGAWADGASWSGVVKRLQGDGYPVVVAPNPLRGLSADSAYLADYLATLAGPIVLAGHSYGGAVITNAATGNTNVKALVYDDAYIPDLGQTVVQLSGPDSALAPAGTDPTSVFNLVPYPGAPTGVYDTYVLPSVFIPAFAADLPHADAAVLAAVQPPTSLLALGEPSGPPAWTTIPSWAVVGSQDRVIPPAQQLAMATHAGAHITEINSSHLSLISHPGAVTDVIETAARAAV